MQNTSKLWLAPLVGLLMFSAAACENMLEEVPLSTLTSANYFENATDALTALNGAYHALNTTNYVSGRRYLTILEVSSPHMTANAGVNSNHGCYDVFNCQPSNNFHSRVWNGMYKAIQNANAVIDNVPDIERMDATLRSRVVGEAKFLRAFHYFGLVRLWGGVPLRRNETNSLKDLETPRSPADEVYAFIIQDLKDAQDVLPQNYPARDWGRATRGAATTLLGKVYLQRAVAGRNNPFGDPLYWPSAQSDDLQNAIAELRKLTDGSYSLLQNYEDLWHEDHEINSEVVFTLQNILHPGQGSDAQRYFSPVGSNWNPAQFLTAHVEIPFYQSYPEGDVRRDVTWLTEFVDKNEKLRVWDPTNVSGDSWPGTGAAPSKWIIQRTDIGEHFSNPRDMVLLRYADVLLMLAEALNEQNNGPDSEAYAMVDEVRQRAGLEPLPEGMGYAEFREALYWERQWELATEQHAWYDGVGRFWDLFSAHVTAHARLRETSPEEYPNNTVPKFVPSFEAKDRLMPIPQEALDRNRELVQTPGW